MLRSITTVWLANNRYLNSCEVDCQPEPINFLFILISLRLFDSVLQNMWFGVLHHVVGEHEWHDGQCSHGPLTAAETGKKLLEKGSKAMDALRKVVMDKRRVESLIFYV